MGKGKGNKAGKGGDNVPNKAVHSRINYLQQAAVLLASTSTTPTQQAGKHQQPSSESNDEPSTSTNPLHSMSRHLVKDLRSIARKKRIRLSPDVKRTLCKYCDSVLIDGKTCESTVENKSREGRKPWADVLVRKCLTCGKEKRDPINTKRPSRKTRRSASETKADEPQDAKMKEPEG